MIFNKIHIVLIITTFILCSKNLYSYCEHILGGGLINFFSNPFYLIFLFSFVFGYNSFAQLSPGKLSKGHTKLEGLTNCTQCHTIGDKVSNQKCLSCHKELNVRVTLNKGYHASLLVKGKDCITCHSEHHGLNFEMIRFDKKSFNHNLTGYELKGAHKTKITNCNECHKPANIANVTLKSKPNTLLGLEPKCLSCHEDYHQKTLSNDCASCHNTNEFKPATLFSHDKTDFALNGAHKKEDCASCHKQEVKNGKKFVKYSNIPFLNCNSCHKDIHNGEFGINCKTCHSEESFNKITPSKSFNHTVTGYTLEGVHREINCKKCHDKSNSTFQEFTNTKDVKCITCHKDIHEGKLGEDCKSCHNQVSFLLKKTARLDKFDHNKTAYPLEGKHETVDCRTCHKKNLTDALSHSVCMNCHDDKHNGDFATKKEIYPDCASCHKVDGFSPSFFTIEQHNKSRFNLDGAHLAQPCFGCHLTDDKKWIFSNMSTECASCHKDIHNEFLDKKYYEKQSCVACHSTESWQAITFDHKTTNYLLEGAHKQATCGGCHIDRTSTPIKQVFKGLSNRCSSCHKEVHGNQFERNGITNCARCHTNDNWGITKFNHDNTGYKLDGKHKSVSCDNCHKEAYLKNTTIRTYRISKHKCADCHLK